MSPKKKTAGLLTSPNVLLKECTIPSEKCSQNAIHFTNFVAFIPFIFKYLFSHPDIWVFASFVSFSKSDCWVSFTLNVSAGANTPTVLQSAPWNLKLDEITRKFWPSAFWEHHYIFQVEQRVQNMSSSSYLDRFPGLYFSPQMVKISIKQWSLLAMNSI